jgi:hypothetical protein
MGRRVRRREHGQTMVEFALALPLFFVLIFGLIDLGRAVYAYNTISNAARVGARAAIVDQTTGTIQSLAAQEAVGLGIEPGDVDVHFGNPDTPELPDPACPLLNCVAVVRVPYEFRASFPVINAIVGTIHMSSTSMMRIERVHP